jgi:parallel beta-helix repeat protein
MVPGATVMRSGLLHRRQLLLAGGAGLASLALPLAAPEAQAVRSFYVATNGSDSAVGSQARPWRTISRAVRDLRPGDEVVVMPGTYNERVGIDRGGNADRADGYVTLRSATPGAARLRPPSGHYSGVLVYTSYVVIDGFDVVGGTGHAIEIGNGHHVKIRNCIAHDSGGGGIAAARSEFITIEGNTVYRNCATSRLHTSGISVYQCRNISGDRSTGGFRTIIRNNVSYANLQKWGNDHFDGNGIIVDDLRHTQVSGFPNYTYPTLVENNLCHSNGGKGIHVFVSDNVTVRNNTSWRNNLDPNNRGTWRSELSNVNSRNNKWINNIAVADTAGEFEQQRARQPVDRRLLEQRHGLAQQPDLQRHKRAGLPARHLGQRGPPGLERQQARSRPRASSGRRPVISISACAADRRPSMPARRASACPRGTSPAMPGWWARSISAPTSSVPPRASRARRRSRRRRHPRAARRRSPRRRRRRHLRRPQRRPRRPPRPTPPSPKDSGSSRAFSAAIQHSARRTGRCPARRPIARPPSRIPCASISATEPRGIIRDLG